MSALTAHRVDANRPESIQTGVADLLSDVSLPNDPSPIVLPELEYPFHPSTGLIANPAVVAAVVAALHSEFSTEIGLAYPGSQYADGEQVASLVGYDAVDDTEVERADLDSADRVERTVRLADGNRTVTTPRPLVDRPVVTVPSLRRGHTHPVVGGMVTTARATDLSLGVPHNVAAAALAVDPAGTVLDGTYSFPGRPHRTGLLAFGQDVVGIDRLAAALLDIDPTDVPALAAVPADAAQPTELRSLSVESLRNLLPDGSPPESDAPGPLVRHGYRLYTQVTGDAYPPQFEP